MLTRNGIAYNLSLSPYKTTIKYGEDDYITFKFSSKLYKDNFKNKLKLNRDNVNNSLSKRFGFSIKCDKISDLKLYSSIEKRGFLIETKEGIYQCLNTIELDGRNKIHNR